MTNKVWKQYEEIWYDKDAAEELDELDIRRTKSILKGK